MRRINASPGEVFELFSNAEDGEDNTVVVQTASMGVSRLHVAAGVRIPAYQAQGELVIVCMSGNITVEMSDRTAALRDGQATFLTFNELFSLNAIEESSMLLIVVATGSTEIGTLLGEWELPRGGRLPNVD